VTVAAAGGRVGRRVLFRASSLQVFGSLLSGQLGAAGAIAGTLHRLARCDGRALWRGLKVITSVRDGGRVFGWVLIAVVCQILRNWLLLHAVGVDASLFDAIAVLIAVVTLGQLPIGPAVGAAAAALILGAHGVAATAAAGVLLTATGTAGALLFVLWSGLDRLHGALRPAA
jgi:hypothetical protein